MTERLYPKKCPSKKKCFATEAEAQPYVDSLAASDHPSRARHLRIYRCTHGCQWFHVGHDYRPLSQRTTRRGKHAPRFPQNP